MTGPARLVLVLLACALASWSPQQAFARGTPKQPSADKAPAPSARSSIHWASPRFAYQVQGKRLAEVLSDFAASQNLGAVVGEGVDGVVQASFDMAPEEFLGAVSRAYGVIWYHDGATLYFYPSRAVQSRIFKLKGYGPAQVQRLLSSLQLVDRRYPLRFDAATATLLVYGPPRHVELVGAAIEALDATAEDRNQRFAQVFRLRYAWAADRKVGNTSVPGIASMLRSLYSGSPGTPAPAAGSGPATATADAVAARAVITQRNYGLDTLTPRVPPEGGATTERSLTGAGPRGLYSPVRGNVEDASHPPAFQADEATNSVIVLDRRERMADYAALIKRLDVAPQLVELEASIIDVSTDSAEQLGVDWSLATRKGRFSVGDPNAGTPAALAITTLWSNAGRDFLARVQALQSEGKARVLSQPRVLGIANRPAMMKQSRVANVRVAGNLEVKLYQVEAGTSLEVTPQVVGTNPGRFKLSIFITDGNFEDTSVDQVPVVKHSEITTEAEIAEGQSLLIGGIALESDTTSNRGVPGLQSVPLVGGMFRWRDTHRVRTERLFLITPRLLNPAEIPPAPGQPDRAN